jgi:hypothetical protein
MSEEFVFENKEMLKAVKKYHESENCRIIGIEITSNHAVNFDRHVSFSYERIIRSKSGDDKYEYGDIGNFCVHGEVWNNSLGPMNESRYYSIKKIDTDLLPLLRILGSMNPDEVQLNVSVYKGTDNPVIKYSVYSLKVNKFLYNFEEKRYNRENLEYSNEVQ